MTGTRDALLAAGVWSERIEPDPAGEWDATCYGIGITATADGAITPRLDTPHDAPSGGWDPVGHPSIQAAVGYIRRHVGAAPAALTTTQACALAGKEPPAFRVLVSHARHRQGVELQADQSLWPDQRTPCYDEQTLLDYLER